MSNQTNPCLEETVHPIYGTYHFTKSTLADISIDVQEQQDKSNNKESSLSNSAVVPTISLRCALESGKVNNIRSALEMIFPGRYSQPVFDQLYNQPDVQSLFTEINALHLASTHGWKDIVEFLIVQTELNVDLINSENETPLYKACLSDQIDIIKLLITLNANVNLADNQGWTPTHNSTSQNSLAGLKLLFLANARLDCTNKRGTTPLMIASGNGFIDSVLFLLGNGANPFLKNDDFESAYDIAAQAEWTFICEILDSAEQKWKSNANIPFSLSDFHNCSLEIVIENQKNNLFSKTFLASNLSHLDPPEWCDKNLCPIEMSNVSLPSNSWFWFSDWKIDLKHHQVDQEFGWQYSFNFQEPNHVWLSKPISTLLSQVRRRRWIRIRKRKVLIKETPLKVYPNYVQEVKSLLPKSKIDFEKICDLQQANSIAENYKTGIEILLRNLRLETNLDVSSHVSSLVDSLLLEAEELDITLKKLEKGKMPIEGPRAALFSSSDKITDQTVDHRIFIPSIPESKWENQDACVECRSCKRVFTFFLRKHHCRWCGLVFCDQCSGFRFPLNPAFPKTPHRVCAGCLDFLKRRTKQFERDKQKVGQSYIEINQNTISSLDECPVCQQDLRKVNQEEHLASCFLSKDIAPKTQTRSEKLKQLIKKECIICLEDFQIGQEVSTLSCLCIFHKECIEKWFATQLQNAGEMNCPTHR